MTPTLSPRELPADTLTSVAPKMTLPLSPRELPADSDTIVLSTAFSAAPDTVQFAQQSLLSDWKSDSTALRGVEGRVMSRRMGSDGGFAAVLLFCAVIAIIAVCASRRSFAEQFRRLFSARDGNAAIPPARGRHWMWLLALEACVVYAAAAFLLFGRDLARTPEIGGCGLFGLLTVFFVLFFVARDVLARLVNRTFFGSVRRYSEALLFLLVCEGLFLLPAVYVTACYDVSLRAAAMYVFSVVIVFRLLAIFKQWQIFFARKGSVSGFFLYLCALEITPFFLMWSVLAILCGRSGGNYW